MVNYRRSLIAGGTYFFTLNLANRQATHLLDHADALKSIIKDVKQQHPFMLDAIVLLPDHLHTVWTLSEGDDAYASRLRLIKSRFTRHLLRAGVAIEKDARGEYALWQKRFWEHTIRDDKDFEAHINYVHINPVKHGYVKRARDWPYSSIHRYIEKGLLTEDWAHEPQAGEYREQD